MPLTPEQLANADETLRHAQQVYSEYYERCFWFMDPGLTVTAENLSRIIEGLRRSGDRRAWLIAEELCR
jgi:hypothetical protein